MFDDDDDVIVDEEYEDFDFDDEELCTGDGEYIECDEEENENEQVAKPSYEVIYNTKPEDEEEPLSKVIGH